MIVMEEDIPMLPEKPECPGNAQTHNPRKETNLEQHQTDE